MQIAVSAPVNMASPVMVWRPSSEIAPSAGPPSSSTWKRQERGPSTRTRWWKTSRAMTPGLSAPVRFTRVVSGTVKSIRSRTKASRSCV